MQFQVRQLWEGAMPATVVIIATPLGGAFLAEN